MPVSGNTDLQWGHSQFGQFSSSKRALADLYAEYDIDLISTLHEIIYK